MKVKTYIGLLSIGSIGGALIVGMFGWWMLSGINQSNRELEQESRNSGILQASTRIFMHFCRLPVDVLRLLKFILKTFREYMEWFETEWFLQKKV